MKKTLIAAVAALLVSTGCDSLKDAMSAHVDVVAKAGDSELTITRMANLIGASKAPIRKDVANAVVDTWVNYHLAAQAAVNNDSLTDIKEIDEAMWAMLANVKAKKWYDQVSKTWKAPDSSTAEAAYNSGNMLAASHILLLTPDSSPAAKAVVKKKIDALRARSRPRISRGWRNATARIRSRRCEAESWASSSAARWFRRSNKASSP